MGNDQSSSAGSLRRRYRSTLQPSTSYDENSRPNNRQRLKFHGTHGKNIRLEENGNVARRFKNFCYGIVFSGRPIEIGEKVSFKLSSLQAIWSGVMRIGVTRKDPSFLVGSELPRYACPDLTNRPGFWAKAISDDFAVENNVFTVCVNRNGVLQYSVNGEDSGTILDGIQTNSPLWLMLDVYGNAVALELLNNVDQITSSQSSLSEIGTVSFQQDHSELNLRAAFHIPTSTEIESMQFSWICGSAVDISNDRLTCFKQITRQIYSFTILYPSSITFTDIPFMPGMTWYLRVKSKSRSHQAYDLGIGVTSVNPSSLTPEEFPEDSEDLIDRSEYWIMNKNLSLPLEGQYFSIFMGFDGHVTCKHQDGTELSLFFVDISRPLWLILDLCGNINSIMSVGWTSSTNPTPSSSGVLNPLHINFDEEEHNIRITPHPAILEDSSSSDEDLHGGGALSWQHHPPSSSSSSESDSMEVVENPTTGGRMGLLGAIASGLVFGLSAGIARSLLRSRSNEGQENGGNEFDAFENGGNEIENGGDEFDGFENARMVFENGGNGRTNLENGGSGSDSSVVDTSGDEYETAQPHTSQNGGTMTHRPEGGVKVTTSPHDAKMNSTLKECVICFDAESDTALYDCGHKCLCDGCATTLMRQRIPKCPICRRRIKDKLKVYG